MGMKKLEKRIKNHKTDDEIHWTTIGLIILLFSFAISVCVVLVYYTEKSPCELGLMEWEEAEIKAPYLCEIVDREFGFYGCDKEKCSCRCYETEKSCPSDIKLLVVE